MKEKQTLVVKININLIVILFIISSQALGSPLEPGYDYYSDDYVERDYSADKDYLNENEKVVHVVPQFVTSPIDEFINEGDTIKLPCYFDKLDGYTILWSKENDVIAVGDIMMNPKDSRIKIKGSNRGNTLTISLAEKEDAGQYVCKVSSHKAKTLTHNVRIRVKPSIKASAPSGIVVVHEGEPATIACDVIRGEPEPKVTMKRKHRDLPNGSPLVEANSLTFNPATRHDSGIYICEADNGFGGEKAFDKIRLDVQHAPVVEQEQTFIHTRENVETEVVCVVHASPEATVTWMKDGQVIDEDSEAGIRDRRHNRHILVLPGIRRSTFGTYTCRAENKFGANEKNIVVSGLASPANFKSEPVGSFPYSYTLEWVVESITPITEFAVEYRIRDTNEFWTKISNLEPESHGDHFYAGEVTLKDLYEGTMYEARVTSKNDYGFNDYNSPPFVFGTKGSGSHQFPPEKDRSSFGNQIAAPMQELSIGNSVSSSLFIFSSKLTLVFTILVFCALRWLS